MTWTWRRNTWPRRHPPAIDRRLYVMPTSTPSAVDQRERRLAVIAITAVCAVIASILAGVIFGELPEAAWVLAVPVGMLGGGVIAIASTVILVFSRRARRAQASAP